MRVMFDGGQHGQALLGHPAAVGTQGGCPCVVGARGIRHTLIQALIMTVSQ
jgi:phosphohistidine swiveling domain-containing protein